MVVSLHMKMLRIVVRIGLGLFVVWGLIALLHRLSHEPDQSRFFFWSVLPYPVLIALTAFVIAMCARNSRSGGTGFSWFAVGLGSSASIGLAMAVSTGLSSIMSWAYFGHVSVSFNVPTDPWAIAISVVMSVACYIWAGAMSTALSPQRPMLHAVAAGVVLLLWSCAMALLVQPPVIWQLLVAAVLPIPFAIAGARLLQVRLAIRN
jgi:hypothetical protein